VVWYLRGNYFRSASESDLVPVAREIVRSLLADGTVRLVRFRMTPPEAWVVDPAELDRILEESRSWRPPPSWSEPYPAMDATDG
jgi:hypothetical protein